MARLTGDRIILSLTARSLLHLVGSADRLQRIPVRPISGMYPAVDGSEPGDAKNGRASEGGGEILDGGGGLGAAYISPRPSSAMANRVRIKYDGRAEFAQFELIASGPPFK